MQAWSLLVLWIAIFAVDEASAACPPGKYTGISTMLQGQTDGGEVCFRCGRGQFQSQSGQHHCHDCPANKFTLGKRVCELGALVGFARPCTASKPPQ